MDALMGGDGLSKSFEEGYEPAGIKEQPQGYTPAFVRNRLLVFAGLVLGYSCYYITRNSFIYTAPVMVEAGVLNMTQVSGQPSPPYAHQEGDAGQAHVARRLLLLCQMIVPYLRIHESSPSSKTLV